MLISKLLDTSIRILIVGAHPDDIEFSTGRLILKRNAINVHTLCLTDGRKGQEGTVKEKIPEEDYVEIRISETKKAQERLGIKKENMYFFHAPDQSLVNNPYIIDRLFLLIKKINPELILIHPFEGAHPDHDAAHLSSMIAAKNYGFDVNNIIEFGSYNNYGGRFRVQEFIPMNSFEEKLLPGSNIQKEWNKMMTLFKSQINQQKDYIPKSHYEIFRRLPNYDYSSLPYSRKNSKIIRHLMYPLARALLSKKDKLFYETWTSKINPNDVQKLLNMHKINY